jgi:hypothetical protein
MRSLKEKALKMCGTADFGVIILCALALVSCSPKSNEDRQGRNSRTEEEARDTAYTRLKIDLQSKGRPGIVLKDSVPVYAALANTTGGSSFAQCHTGDCIIAINAGKSARRKGSPRLKYYVSLEQGETEGWVDAEAVRLLDGSGEFDKDYFRDTTVEADKKAYYSQQNYLSPEFYQRALKNPHLAKMSQRLALMHSGRHALIVNDNIFFDRRDPRDTVLYSGEKVIVINLPPQDSAYSVILEDGAVGKIETTNLFIFNNNEAWDAYLNSDASTPPAFLGGEPNENGAILYSEPFLRRATLNNRASLYSIFQRKLKKMSGKR